MNTSRPTWEAKPFLTRQELLLLLSVALFSLAIVLVVAIYLLVSGSQGVPVEEVLPVSEEPVQVMLDQAEPIVLETSGYTWVMTPRATFAKAIPFITVSGVGPHEAGWTMGFRLIGMALDDALASGLAVNMLTLTASLIAGSVMALYRNFYQQQAGAK